MVLMSSKEKGLQHNVFNDSKIECVKTQRCSMFPKANVLTPQRFLMISKSNVVQTQCFNAFENEWL